MVKKKLSIFGSTLQWKHFWDKCNFCIQTHICNKNPKYMLNVYISIFHWDHPTRKLMVKYIEEWDVGLTVVVIGFNSKFHLF
jgi:hypothetical protein